MFLEHSFSQRVSEEDTNGFTVFAARYFVIKKLDR